MISTLYPERSLRIIRQWFGFAHHAQKIQINFGFSALFFEKNL